MLQRRIAGAHNLLRIQFSTKGELLDKQWNRDVSEGLLTKSRELSRELRLDFSRTEDIDYSVRDPVFILCTCCERTNYCI